MEPIHMVIGVPALTVAIPLAWYVLGHRRRERQARGRRVEAMRWIARNMDAPSLRGMVFSVDEDGRIHMEPRR